MKKLIFLLLLIPILSFSQKKKTAFIVYFVPISKNVKKKYFVLNRNVQYWKYYSTIVDNNSSDLTEDLTNSSFLTRDSKQILFNNIFNKAKNGELVVYKHSDEYGFNFFGPSPNNTWRGEKEILKKQEIQRNISYLRSRISTDKEGEVIIDDNGLLVYEQYLEKSNIDDFIGIKFYEEWIFDYKNLTIDKKILAYAPAIRAISPVTNELVGFRCPFIVENKNLKTNQIIATDFYSNTDIFCSSDADSWFYGNLEPSVKYPFIKEALTNENNSYYECSPPYNKKISNIDALSFESFRDSIGDDGNQGIDKDGNAVLAKDLNYYLPDEINSFGFVENWFFDKKNSSFGKEVNGISLEVSGVINYVEDVIKPIFLDVIKPIFLIKN